MTLDNNQNTVRTFETVFGQTIRKPSKVNANDATIYHATTYVVGRCHSRNYIFLYDMDGFKMNLRQEICRILEANNTKLLAAQIEYLSNEDKYKAQSIYEEVVKTVMLYKDYEDDEIEDFFEAIDFEYSGGSGTPEVEGVLWFTNGTYATRQHEAGQEWWEVHTVPKIPARGQRLNLCL